MTNISMLEQAAALWASCIANCYQVSRSRFSRHSGSRTSWRWRTKNGSHDSEGSFDEAATQGRKLPPVTQRPRYRVPSRVDRRGRQNALKRAHSRWRCPKRLPTTSCSQHSDNADMPLPPCDAKWGRAIPLTKHDHPAIHQPSPHGHTPNPAPNPRAH